MKIELVKKRNRRFSIYLSLFLFISFIIFNIYIGLTDGIHAMDLVNPLFIIVLILFLPDFRQFLFGKQPFIQVNYEKVSYKEDYFKKPKSILVKNLKEIRCRQNTYSFIGKNGEIIEIPLGILSYNDVHNFKNQVNTLVSDHSLVYRDF